MRRTASEVIRSLEKRVARLEKNAHYIPPEIESDSVKIERAKRTEWSASDFLREYKQGQFVKGSVFLIKGEELTAEQAIRKYKNRYPSIVQALHMAKMSDGVINSCVMTVINVHGKQRHLSSIQSDWDFIINGKHYTSEEAKRKFGRVPSCRRGILEAQEHKVFEGLPFKVEYLRTVEPLDFDYDIYEG